MPIVNQVRVIFEDLSISGSTFVFPLVQAISDPQEGMKATVIPGTRADGSIVIPGGKRSQEIVVRGIIFDNAGYNNIITVMDDMRSEVTTNPGTLSLQHWNGGSWSSDWSYTVIRVNEIEFSDSLRYVDQEYTVRFLVLAY
jgi:hypothetical protein